MFVIVVVCWMKKDFLSREYPNSAFSSFECKADCKVQSAIPYKSKPCISFSNGICCIIRIDLVPWI